MRLRLLISLALASAVTACSTQTRPDASTPHTLTVFAAASLTGTFTELGRRFEAANPGVKVIFDFAGSPELAQQIVNGAAADVFATASPATMDTVTRAGLAAGKPAIFARNTLQIAVAPGNPKGVTRFADLARPGMTVVVAAPQVPCGAAEQTVEKLTGVDVQPVSEEPDVRTILSKVEAGDADAGVVYISDVRAGGGRTQGVAFPEANQARSAYPIVALGGSRRHALADSFVSLVRSPAGAQVLTTAGFDAP